MVEDTQDYSTNQQTPAPPPKQVASADTTNPIADPKTEATSPATPASPQPTSPQPTEPNPKGVDTPTFKQDPANAAPLSAPEKAAGPTEGLTPQEKAVQQRKGSWIHTLAESMTGGARYRTTIDPNSGEIKQERVHLSRGDLGMAIALEAISGGMAGLAAKGPNAKGQGFLLGERQGQKIAEAGINSDDKEFARAAAITRTNFEMARNQSMLSDADYQTHQRDVDAYASVYKEADKGGFVDKVVTEDELHKMLQSGDKNVSKDMAIPIRVVPKLDDKGNGVRGKYGEKTYQKMYAIVKPNAQITLPEDVRKLLVDNQVQGYVDSSGKGIDLPTDLEQRMHLVVAGIEKANLIRWSQAAFDGHAKGQFNAHHSDTAPETPSTGATKAGKGESVNPTLSEMFKDKDGTVDYDRLALSIAQHEGSHPTDRNVRNNNPGNLKDGKYAQSQLGYEGTDGTYAKFKTTEDGMNALRSMLKRDMPKYGDKPVDEYFRKVYVSGGSEKEVQDYAKAIMQSAGKQPEMPSSKGQEVPGGGTRDEESGPTTTMSVTDALRQHVLTTGDLEIMRKVGGIEAFRTGNPKNGELTTAQKIAEEAGKKGDTELPAAIGRLVNFMGGQQAIDDFRDKRLQHFADQDEARAVDKAQKEAANKTKLDQESANEMDSFLNMPKDFNFTPELVDLDPRDLKARLEAQGVKVPKNLSSMWLVAHYRAPVSSFAPRVWTKGSPHEMDQQTAESYIQQFINPDFNVQKYASAQKLRNDLVSANTRDGGAIRNADTAVQHLSMLDRASVELKNNNTQFFNSIANEYGKQTGDAPIVVFNAIAQKVNAEVEKVAAGGNVPFKDQLSEGLKNLDSSNAPQQIEGVIRAYTKLMAGRIHAVDNNSYAELGEHLHNVSPEVSALFRKYGAPTPWDLPTGNGQKIDNQTAQSFLDAAHGNPDRARTLAKSKNWMF